MVFDDEADTIAAAVIGGILPWFRFPLIGLSGSHENGKIIVELKAQDNLSGRKDAQILNCLQVAGVKLGLIINFGFHPKLEWKRLIL